jgi:hypothetical protein
MRLLFALILMTVSGSAMAQNICFEIFDQPSIPNSYPLLERAQDGILLTYVNDFMPTKSASATKVSRYELTGVRFKGDFDIQYRNLEGSGTRPAKWETTGKAVLTSASMPDVELTFKTYGSASRDENVINRRVAIYEGQMFDKNGLPWRIEVVIEERYRDDEGSFPGWVRNGNGILYTTQE